MDGDAQTRAKRARARFFAPLVVPLRTGEATLAEIADLLNTLGYTTVLGHAWGPSSVWNLVQTLKSIDQSEQTSRHP